ncbi:hypothetical protein VZ95_13300 [Elstera litoralis]|uniref:Methyl-accepting transducer domain-containing protein n=2 Tax=Elstera litoralis TaxID=552518 RepID=A0A0F3IRH7_9PROT|nr:hypothetical protein VZ95_13300 [Elstera litoralis]
MGDGFSLTAPTAKIDAARHTEAPRPPEAVGRRSNHPRTAARFLLTARYRKLRSLDQLAAVSSLITTISALIHELQKERGSWNVYLNSNGRQFAAQIDQQIDLCRTQEHALRVGCDGLDRMAHPAAIFLRVGDALHGLDRLPELRQRAKALTVTARDATAAFSSLIAQLLTAVAQALDVIADPDISRALIGLFNFMQGKEYAGQERATGSAGFSAGIFDAAQHRRFLDLIAAQARSFRIFAEYATPTQAERARQVFSGPKTATFERMRHLASANGMTGPLDGIDGRAWYDQATQRIDGLKQVEDALAADLHALCKVKRQEAWAEFNAPIRSLIPEAGWALRIDCALTRHRLTRTARWENRLAADMREAVASLSGRKRTTPWMTATVRLFQTGLGDAATLAAQQQQERLAQEERQQNLEDAVHEFGATSRSVLATLAGMATRMHDSAQRMFDSAEEACQRSMTLASASRQSLAGVQAVAQAADDLSTAVRDITTQAEQTSHIARATVEKFEHTATTVTGLQGAAGRIGDVVTLIQSIASQTNLLALNATIEAARAGEAGKGFAVVAGEVKTLANQTAGATSDIARQVTNIQTESTATVDTIAIVRAMMDQMETVIAQSAAALVHQKAATDHIAVSIQHVAGGAQAVSDTVEGVAHAADDSGTIAAQVLDISKELETISSTIQDSLARFMDKVRTH